MFSHLEMLYGQTAAALFAKAAALQHEVRAPYGRWPLRTAGPALPRAVQVSRRALVVCACGTRASICASAHVRAHATS